MRFRIILLLVSLLCCWTSCSLEVPLEDRVSDPGAITSIAAAERAAAAAYLSYTGWQYTLQYSILAGDFHPSSWLSSAPAQQQLYLWAPQALIDLSNTLWREHYHTITLCNVLLTRIGGVQPTAPGELQKRRALEGTTLLLKAQCYLQLLQLYAPSPAKVPGTTPAIPLRDAVEASPAPRASIAEAVQEIKRLIGLALPLVVDNNALDAHWLGYPACLLLSAQLALWQGDYVQAAQEAQRLLALYPQLLEATPSNFYQTMWGGSSPGDALFLYDLSRLGGASRPFQDNLQYDPLWGDFFLIPPHEALSPDDARKSAYELPFSAPDGTTALLWGKYNAMNRQGVEYHDLYAARATEALFICAEALAHLNDLQGAQQLLEGHLRHVGLPKTLAPSTQKELLAQILQEKRIEFRGEGVSFFDAKRCAVAPLARYTPGGKLLSSILPDDYRWCWPIPKAELRLSEGMTQNPGW